jgi:hypothetical protein
VRGDASFALFMIWGAWADRPVRRVRACLPRRREGSWGPRIAQKRTTAMASTTETGAAQAVVWPMNEATAVLLDRSPAPLRTRDSAGGRLAAGRAGAALRLRRQEIILPDRRVVTRNPQSRRRCGEGTDRLARESSRGTRPARSLGPAERGQPIARAEDQRGGGNAIEPVRRKHFLHH